MRWFTFAKLWPHLCAVFFYLLWFCGFFGVFGCDLVLVCAYLCGSWGAQALVAREQSSFSFLYVVRPLDYLHKKICSI